jgi:DNA-binding NarL/FixJ family response regulator
MWIRIRAVIIEDEPLAAQYLAALLDDTCQVEVVDTAADSESGLRLCAELRPDVVFLDINLPGRDGVSLATQLAMLPQPPRLVYYGKCRARHGRLSVGRGGLSFEATGSGASQRGG